MNMDSSKVLKENGMKVTPQRVAILDFLQNTTEHPTAEIIYTYVGKEYPSISFATVYKTLDSFRSKNIISEINVGEDFHRYDANTNDHPHFICDKCKRVLDIHDVEGISRAVKKIEKNNNIDVNEFRLLMYGTCSSCKNK
ncbi:MAG: Fur family transcriptional regulator [Lachnospirales bacterium]